VERVKSNVLKLEITRFSKQTGTLHWKLTNQSKSGVFVYDFFLLGGAFEIERSPGKLIFDTSPIRKEASCPPNRTIPVLLLLLPPGGVMEGDFVEPQLRQVKHEQISLKIAAGSEPYTVVDEAKRYYDSDCAHSPYDAVVDWATYIESNSIHVP
jgi:hypothetical protein